MFVAGIDAHATYVVVAIVSNDGALVQKPLRIRNTDSSKLVHLLGAYTPLEVVLDRDRGASFVSILVAGSGMFGVFLFLTYYLQSTLGFTPMQTGVGFLPMVVSIIITAQIQSNLLIPRFGPKLLVPIGMLLAASGMLTFTTLEVDSPYTRVLPGLVLMGIGMASIMPASFQLATLGVEPRLAGAASALVSTSQQVGGAIGTALLNTLAATAATAYVTAHAPATPENGSYLDAKRRKLGHLLE